MESRWLASGARTLPGSGRRRRGHEDTRTSHERNDPGLIIIGSGFAGLCMAIRLKQAGYHDFVILEKNDDLGGTWRDNTYPGCACDVPSHMYAFSFELSPAWSRMFAPQREIWDYIRHCVAKYGISPHIRFDRPVERMEWDETTGRWHIATATGEAYTARAVVSGIGAPHVPSVPEIPGAGQFTGAAFHSAQWDQSCDLSGKRVAVIGTGPRRFSSSPRSPRLPPRFASSSGRRHGSTRGPTLRSRPRSVPLSPPPRR